MIKVCRRGYSRNQRGKKGKALSRGYNLNECKQITCGATMKSSSRFAFAWRLEIRDFDG